MKPTRIFATIALSAAALAGCSDQPDTMGVATTTATHTVTPPATTSPATSGSTPPEQDTAAEGNEHSPDSFAPGDPRLVIVDGVGKTGMFMDPDTGKYYVCNGGELTAAEGAPVESGTCAGPFADYYAAGDLTSQLSGAVGGAIEREAVDEGLIDPVDEGDITARFWECMENGGTEETCRQ